MAKVRVSCSNLVRVNLDGKIVLSVNRARASKGLRVYSPIGGVLTANTQGLEYLKGQLDCEFGKENADLRFRMDDSRLPDFEEWFFSYTGRELSPYRELCEEFVDEERVFPSLPLSTMDLEKIVDVEERKVTDKPGDEGTLTQRYFEVWGLEFSDAYQEIVRDNLKNPDATLLLTTEQEIRNLRSITGYEIRDSSLALILDKTKTPYRTLNIGSRNIVLYKN